MPVNGSLPICLAQKLFSPPHQYRAAFFSTSRPILPSFRHSRKPFSRARAIPLPLRTQQRKTLTPFGILFLFGATYAFYSHTMKQPLLCEAPPPLERSCLNYADTFDFPDMESINKTFASHEISYRGAPRCGYVRYDCTSLPANQPGEDIASDTMVGDPNENMVSGPWMVTMWGLYDGHVGDITAAVLSAYLPRYIMDLIGISGPSFADARRVLQNSSSEHINQSIRDAFVRLDNDIMTAATDAITGSHSLLKSMISISPADSGSCALLAYFESATQLLRVACVGDSRAVLGRRRAEGGWDTIPLSKDQTCYNEDEVARLRREHPGEPDMIQGGRLLGLAVTRAFGDLRWKLSAHLQSLSQERFFGLPTRPSFLTPPYLTAEPVITTTKVDVDNNDFLIMASDGLWDHLSSEQAVDLVGRWLEKNDVQEAPEMEITLDLDSTLEDGLQPMYRTSNPPTCPVEGRKYTKAKYADEKNWVVVDKNAASHLVRNALGGADEDLLAGLMGTRLDSFARRMSDDITVKVIFFGNLKEENEKGKDSISNSTDTIEHM